MSDGTKLWIALIAACFSAAMGLISVLLQVVNTRQIERRKLQHTALMDRYKSLESVVKKLSATEAKRVDPDSLHEMDAVGIVRSIHELILSSEEDCHNLKSVVDDYCHLLDEDIEKELQMISKRMRNVLDLAIEKSVWISEELEGAGTLAERVVVVTPVLVKTGIELASLPDFQRRAKDCFYNQLVRVGEKTLQ